MNRQTAVDAVDATGRITATQGHQLAYDLDGNRIRDTFWGNKVSSTTVVNARYDFNTDAITYDAPITVYTVAKEFVTETYTYDAADRLQVVRRDGFVIDQRRYDGAGRLVQSAPVGLPAGYADKLNEGVPSADQLGLVTRRFQYDANGRLLQQVNRSGDGARVLQTMDYRADGSTPEFDGLRPISTILRVPVVMDQGLARDWREFL